MTSSEPARAGADWLSLREPADAAARSADLVTELAGHLADAAPHRLLVHDLGCGSGSMARWLAPRLPGPQHWVLHDRDSDLLPLVHADPPRPGADGTSVTVETRLDDITRIGSGLEGASLVTASALLDMMTGPELDRFVEVCCRPGCPVLVALTVTGHVGLTPEDPLDRLVGAAFDAHQRRPAGADRRLGPDAGDAAVAAFRARGRTVDVRPSPWTLGTSHPALTQAWLTGWLAAAVEQQPGLAAEVAGYARRRRRQLREGRLEVTVGHTDLLVHPA